VAGKTGTSQNPHGEDHAWFVGYAPWNDPVIAVCVMVENAGHGGAVAAPMAGRILRYYFAHDGEQFAAGR
jgi:penicillin-binding protein 2